MGKDMIRGYVRYLKLQRGMSGNTLDAYQRDLQKLLDYLGREGKDVLEVTLEDLQHFAAGLHDIGIHPRSQCRILSGIRSFYHFLLLDGYRDDDPTELLESPQIGEHLPEVLSTAEVDQLEASIDLSKWEGHRNRAIIETLFSCGLRVSELVNLKLSSLYLDEEFVRVLGKGSKERLVPISKRAIQELQAWRGGLCVSQPSWGSSHARDDPYYDQAPGRVGRHPEDHLAPHLAPLLCHSLARRRRRSSHHPGTIGP